VTRISTAGAPAIGTFLIALAIYVRTLLPGPSVGDWGEMQLIPAQFGVPHPTGYPLYMVVGKLFSLLPVGSVAFRADLLSALCAAGAAAISVLISSRLGVRPVIAGLAGVTLAVTGTLWTEATFAEVNTFHLLLVAALIHRALVWRAERRDSDLRLGGLLVGLSLANHPLAISVAPIVVLWVLADARGRLRERPSLVLQAAALALLGVSVYAVIPLRALAGPASVYGGLLTWDGLSGLVTGAQFRGDMHVGTVQSLDVAARAVPSVVGLLAAASNAVFVVAGLVGAVLLLARDRWPGTMFVLLVATNVYLFANYVGDLDHYLLLTWLVLSVWTASLAEALIKVGARRLGPWFVRAQVLFVVLPLTIAMGNWATHDESENRIGEGLAGAVFGQLPSNAVLVTYWDALTTLSYMHCIEGQRPDVSLRAFDPAARVTCDLIDGSLEDVARSRPVFALFVVQGELDQVRGSFDLIPGPSIAVPYGHKILDYRATLFRLAPRPQPQSAAEP
jgi:Protein of unknown function (DUF2723)